MAQQINLCTPILLTQKRYFSAQTMAQALAVFVVLGGLLCAYWVWSLNSASGGFRKAIATQAPELESLQAAIARGKTGAGPAEAGLDQQLQRQQMELRQREQLFEELQRGLFRPGWGHAAHLQLVARSIPAQVWVTQVKADERALDVSGFTLEPAELNAWVAKLAASPLMQGKKLATVKVENTTASTTNAAGGAPRPVWSFHLLSSLDKPSTLPGAKK